jgi:hypothetical protein
VIDFLGRRSGLSFESLKKSHEYSQMENWSAGLGFPISPSGKFIAHVQSLRSGPVSEHNKSWMTHT